MNKSKKESPDIPWKLPFSHVVNFLIDISRFAFHGDGFSHNTQAFP
jgi:hypothetical protein